MNRNEFVKDRVRNIAGKGTTKLKRLSEIAKLLFTPLT